MHTPSLVFLQLYMYPKLLFIFDCLYVISYFNDFLPVTLAWNLYSEIKFEKHISIEHYHRFRKYEYFALNIKLTYNSNIFFCFISCFLFLRDLFFLCFIRLYFDDFVVIVNPHSMIFLFRESRRG